MNAETAKHNAETVRQQALSVQQMMTLAAAQQQTINTLMTKLAA